MQEYSITNEKGQWITGNIQKGCYEWTNNKEKRYTMEFNKACYVICHHKLINCEIVACYEHENPKKGRLHNREIKGVVS
jgi:hypothetical protein